jgi:hypothetical protein
MSTPLTAETFTPLDDLDPATPGDPFTRLRYHYGQLLGAEDFETEQRYFLLRSRLHNALLHGMGTVWGLRVRAEETADPAGLRLICEPGLAIDALGREVYVPLSVCLNVSGLAATPFWADLAPPPAAPPAAGEGGGEGGGEEAPDPRRRVYVVLSYRACLSAPVPAVTPPCTDSDASLVHSRVLDGYRICLQAEAPPDPAATQRDVTRLAGPPGPRERLLDLILHPTLDLARFWGGADEAPVLLAVLDLEPVGNPVERVKLSGAVDNGVRALLPAVQAVADLALGVRLDGAPGPAAFQALGLTAVAGTGADAGLMLVTVATTATLDPGTLADPQAARLLRWDAAGPGWKEPAIDRREVAPTGILIVVKEDWTTSTAYQVLLAGSGAHALLDTQGRLLAGAVGEALPAGSGRDACLSATFNPAA